jgi:hypothetical protein
MIAFNVVRFRVKPGRESEFIDLHRKAPVDFSGWRSGALVKTGNQTYCFVGEWDNFDSIVAARPGMISMLDSFRDMLEDLGNGLGVTDPMSGEAIVQLGARRNAKSAAKARPKKAKAAAKPAKKTAGKKRAAKKAKARRR